MGSGKSTAGKKLAAALKRDFVDLDDVITELEGQTITQIFDRKGEPYFREAEKKALRQVSARQDMVVACGGGTPCSDENMSELKRTGVVIYLKMSHAALASRLMHAKDSRPLLAGAEKEALPEKVTMLLGARAKWYEQADITADGINVDIKTITEVLADRYGIRRL